MNSIIAECAAYTGTPVPGFQSHHEPLVASRSYQDYDFIPTQKSCTPSPSPPAVSVPSLSHSVPSSPLSKEAPSVWFTDQDGGEPYLTVPSIGDGPSSGQSTRPASPSSGWDSSGASVTWAPPPEEEDDPGPHHHHHRKRPAGKTLVVYNTLSGDALKQQTKIQKKMALQRRKHGQLRNDVTTVFTDPVSGQAVNGDMLGLNYRPIEVEPSDKDTRVPMSLVLSFVSSYLVMGAVLFSSLESWHFVDSFYFCFITLSTIGFGDLVPVPGKSRLRDQRGADTSSWHWHYTFCSAWQCLRCLFSLVARGSGS
ncbi:UNVERIFIED_CONTAM: hypothetical protein GTU68_051993 [Idotea baltica]|nr:hypothetical protein [Idotea baltica]